MKSALFVTLLAMQASSLFSGCASTPKYDQEKLQGKWEAKAQLKDFKTGQSQTISLDFVAKWPDKMRVEVTGPLGVSLASIVMSGPDIKYILYKQKKYYEGATSSKALYPIFNVHLNPLLFMNVLFDKAPTDSEFICQNGDDGKLQKCARMSGIPLTVEWKDRVEELKKVVINGTEYEIQVAFKSFSPKVEENAALFALRPPPSYKKFRLR